MMNASQRRTRRLLLKAAPAGILYAMGIGRARALSSPPEDVDRYLERLCREQHIPGLSVCIVGQRGIAWSKGYGFASLEPSTRMSPSQNGAEYRFGVKDGDGHGLNAAVPKRSAVVDAGRQRDPALLPS